MPDYEALYHLLFNAITDAMEDIAGGNYALAGQRLAEAQCEAEEMYINAAGE